MNSVWFTKQWKQQATYATRWARMHSIRTAQHWFDRFKNRNFELDDLPHTRRPLEMDMDVLKQLIEEDPRLTTRCLAERLGCSHVTVETDLYELGKT
jgi:hypothetical protein